MNPIMTRSRQKSKVRRSDRNPRPRHMENPRELSREEARQVQEHLLEQIAQGASLCRELEEQLRKHPAPELETIIKIYRVLVLKLSAEVQAVPELRQLISALLRPVMDWARLEEKRKDRELVEKKEREE